MAFTVQDFHDLVKLIEEHPEWRADLRRLVLTEELLRVPDEMRELRGVVRELAEQVDQLGQRVDQLALAQHKTEQALGVLVHRVERLTGDVGSLRGWRLESEYRERAGAYLSRLVRRARVVSTNDLAEMLDDAVDAGRLDVEERNDLMLADVVVRGRRLDDGREQYLVVEVSDGLGLSDVERAVRRAGVLAKLHETVPVVAGRRLDPEWRQAAESRGVAVVVHAHDGDPPP